MLRLYINLSSSTINGYDSTERSAPSRSTTRPQRPSPRGCHSCSDQVLGQDSADLVFGSGATVAVPEVHVKRDCCSLVLDSVTSTPQWIRQPENPRSCWRDNCLDWRWRRASHGPLIFITAAHNAKTVRMGSTGQGSHCAMKYDDEPRPEWTRMPPHTLVHVSSPFFLFIPAGPRPRPGGFFGSGATVDVHVNRRSCCTWLYATYIHNFMHLCIHVHFHACMHTHTFARLQRERQGEIERARAYV